MAICTYYQVPTDIMSLRSYNSNMMIMHQLILQKANDFLDLLFYISHCAVL